jgi:hypothetical protein
MGSGRAVSVFQVPKLFHTRFLYCGRTVTICAFLKALSPTLFRRERETKAATKTACNIAKQAGSFGKAFAQIFETCDKFIAHHFPGYGVTRSAHGSRHLIT